VSPTRDTTMSDINDEPSLEFLLKPLTASHARRCFRGRKSLMMLHSWDDIVYCDIGRVFEYKKFEKEWEHITHNETELMRSATAHRHQQQQQQHQQQQRYHQQRYYHPPTSTPAHYPMSHQRSQGYHCYGQQGQGQHSQSQSPQGAGAYYNSNSNSNGCGPPPVSNSYSQSAKSEAAMFDHSNGQGLTQSQPPQLQHSQGNASYKSYNSSSMSQSLSTQSALCVDGHGDNPRDAMNH